MTEFLSIIALISAIITICAKMRENTLLQYIFKPLTMLAIILLAILNASSPLTFYQKMIIIGLIFSTVGDVFLIDSRRFVQGLISFLLTHICFIIAFFSTPNLPSLIFYLAYVAFFLSVLWKHLGNLKIPVFFYSVALALMSWFALSRYFELIDLKSLFTFLGSVSFVVSDSLLAFNKFKSPFPFAEILILSTYFAAQWLIALSV
ncbi:MAG TPA: lysoplasmalogenase [Pyrinomonadaceae bacterium]|nr:lysoplasmalogenase [Pyrinomonadaceae bacterium]